VLDEKPTFVPGGSAGERSGGAQEVPYGAAAVRAVFDVDVEDPFKQSRPADARQRALRLSVFA
jgi:hypothetical protein